jgi:spermidine synthase
MWFYDSYPPFYGFRTGHKIEKLLYHKKTPFQEIKIFESGNFGRVFILDKATQLTEKDEFIYHEMLVHPALLSHLYPKKVLIIGGGDGGALRECLKYKSVDEVYLVEIDGEVIEAAKKFLKFVHQNSFDDRRAKIIVEDGYKFLMENRYKNYFDVIIVDCTDPDPESISLVLFQDKFYKAIYESLTSSGILIYQSGSLFFTPKGYLEIYKKIKKIFPLAGIYWTVIPSYPGAIWGFTYGSKKVDIKKISLKYLEKKYKKLKLKTKFYSPMVHQNSFYLPNFILKK